MSFETNNDNLRAIEALKVQSSDHVLDIGTGHGRALPKLAAQASAGSVTGVDPSDLMIRIAKGRDASLVRADRIRLVKADAANLPFADNTFDKAMAVHALYFWNNLGASVKEIARVLKPGGRLALVFRSASDPGAVAAFPADVYQFPALQEIEELLQAAGMVIDVVEIDESAAKPRPSLVVARRRASQ